MDYSAIINIIIKIIVAIIGLAVTAFIPKAKAWLSERVESSKLEKLEAYVNVFVQAAEQQFKIDDPTGEKRKAYVCDQLEALGVIISPAINAMIESSVFAMNK